MNRGRLIAFEGLDGAGKSTQVARLAAALRAGGSDVLETREPTDGPIGRRLRALARSGRRAAPAVELAWFEDDRREHVAEVIEPALAAGRVVLCDRYFLSSAAYQGARGLDPEAILAQSERRFPLPDLALLLEIGAEAGLERVHARGAPLESSFERAEYLVRVAAVYRELQRPWIARIDASHSPAAVAAAVRAAVERHLGL